MSITIGQYARSLDGIASLTREFFKALGAAYSLGDSRGLAFARACSLDTQLADAHEWHDARFERALANDDNLSDEFFELVAEERKVQDLSAEEYDKFNDLLTRFRDECRVNGSQA